MYAEFLQDNYHTLMRIANCMQIGVWITDGDGRVVFVNDWSIKSGGMSRQELMGKTMTELVEMGYVVNEVASLKALKTGETVSMLEEMGEGGYCLCTSVPLYSQGKIDLIVTVERDYTEVVELRELLDDQKSTVKNIRTELLKTKMMINNKSESTDMIVSDTNMIRLKEFAERMALSKATIMLTGESGTGKEVFANLIHKNSVRHDKPFLKINCAAIPESLIESEFFGYEPGSFTGAKEEGKIGIFEQAHGGTLFLDEIGELPLAMQSKLFRVLNDKEIRRIGGTENIPVDVRIISATNQDLKKQIEEGSFRRELFYRLYVVPIEIPPLRERPDDIASLANFFVSQFNNQYLLNKSLSEDAVKVMKEYHWPGNVRELKNVIERLVVGGAGQEITKFQMNNCLNGHFQEGLLHTGVISENESLDDMVREYEKQIIQQVLNESENATEAAEKLKINKSTISRKRKQYGL